jgi:hypothetical protein
MSTRKRRGLPNPNTPNTPHSQKSSLPPSRKGKATAQHKTTLPFSGVRFNTFVYVLSGLALAFTAVNVWRVWKLKTAAGGWWPLLGQSAFRAGPGGAARSSSRAYDTENHHGGGEYGEKYGEHRGVENLILSLAEALGLPSHELASAVVEAVKNHASSQTSSSISASDAMHSMAASKDPEDPSREAVGDGSAAFAGFADPGMD